ncbi:MAG: sigma-70 family RNA polymerase sigma factor [Ruminococcaceae bacterium]|nr:sigma-70 family RNA polymerase sigma factor [Oscillospiraceae bacterium]
MELQGRTVRTPIDDEKIIELYWQRDERAIEETDVKYRKYLLTVAYNIIHDAPDGEECLNDTYLSAWNAMPPTKPSVLRAFLTTIMRRIAVNRYHIRLKKGNVPSEMTVSLSEVEACVPENEMDAYLLGRLISDYLRTLTERQRFIFMSRYYISNTVDRIAADLRVSRSTVNKELAFIRNGLREKLESEGYPV